MTSSNVASALLIQNLIRLCSELKLPIAYKVSEVQKSVGRVADDTKTFYIIVHVLSDSAFKKYLQNCSQSDLMLFRGLLLKVTTNSALDKLHSAQLQQAFLPKFENEGQDSSVADSIVAAANERFMVVTIKHSGSLVTLSGHQGFAAKNSLNNEFTAGAATLLRVHFQRLEHGDTAKADSRLAALMAELRSHHMAVSFEMVTGCHGHHGQLPAAEYLVTTSAYRMDPESGRPAFLPWLDFMRFCMQHGLPVNDTWLFAGSRWAGAARDTLDELALQGGATDSALSTLTSLVREGRPEGCLYLPGTYPHNQWQGSRIEGFVIAQGQVVTPQVILDLEQLQPDLSASVLSLEAVAEALRQPYRHLQQDKGDSKAVQAAITEACRPWLPCMQLQSPSPDDKAKVMKLLEAPIGELQGGVMLPLPSGGQIYSRTGLAHSSPKTFADLQEALQQQRQTQDLGPLLGLLQQASSLATKTGDAAERRSVLLSLMRTLAGAPELTLTLRYKKKMSMWSFAPAGQPSSKGVVGYCMMTFVIRNGLKALGLGLPTYLNYITNLVRNWGLPAAKQAQVLSFARAWAEWVKARGTPVKEDCYLDQAELFVTEWLRCRGKMQEGQARRPQGSFQGVLVLLDTSKDLASAVAERLQARHLPDAENIPPFSKELVEGGTVLWVPEGSQPPKRLQALADAAAPHLFVAVQRLRPEAQHKGSKQQAGMQTSKLKILEKALQKLQPSPTGPPRIKYLDAGKPGRSNQAVGGVVDAIHDWLGAGAPLPSRDPAVICCFVTIPGTGKSVLTQGLHSRLPPGERSAAGAKRIGQRDDGPALPSGISAVDVKVLSSDIMKATIKNFKGNRYWPDVGDAAYTCVGGGSCTLVIGDKNLCPSPRGNLERVLGQLGDSGASTLAVLPCCRGVTSQILVPQLYEGLPDLPLPLEFIALCMLRVLGRKKHEGGLDADLPEALRIVAMFANFFKNMTWIELRQRVQAGCTSVEELPIMRGVGEDAAAAAHLPGSKLEQMLSHVAEGMRNVSEAKHNLPDEWETRARELLRDPEVSSALLALQRPLAELQDEVATATAALMHSIVHPETVVAGEDLGAALSTTMQQQLTIRGAAAQQLAEDARVRWIGIAGLSVAPVLEAAQALPLAPEVLTRIQAGRPNYHVTLWHVDDPVTGKDQELRERLMAAVGQEAVLEVVSIDSCTDVTAAQVRLLAVPVEVGKQFPHMTLAVGPKALPKDANTLPDRVQAGIAQRHALSEVVRLTGQILAFTSS